MSKKIVAMLMAVAMAFSLLPVTAFATGGTQEGNSQPVTASDKNLTMNKTVEPNQDGTYTVRLESYATGEVKTTTTTEPRNIVLLLDVSGSMGDPFTRDIEKYQPVYKDSLDTNKTYLIKQGWRYEEVTYCPTCKKWTRGCHDSWLTGNHREGKIFTPTETENDTNNKHTQFYQYVYISGKSKMDALKTAVNNFIEGIAKNSPQSNISIVKFAGEKTDIIGNNVNRSGKNYTQIVKELTKVDNTERVNQLKKAVSELKASGSTASDYGLEKAKEALQNVNQDKVVVLFTDGEPNHQNGFDYKVATDAVNTAKTLKEKDTTIYTVGVFKNPSDDINLYMSSVSSNYPNATAKYEEGSWLENDTWTVIDGDSDSGTYYKTADSADELINAFKTISSQVSSTHLNGNAVVVDKVPSNFKAPANAQDVTLKVADYQKGNTFREERTAHEGEGITATVKDGTVSVTGFNFSENWCGVDGTTPHGKKLIIEFTIERTNYGGTQRTNAGAYIKAGKVENEEPIIKLDDPQVPVTISLGSKQELLKNPEVTDEKPYDGTGFAILPKIAEKANALATGTDNAYVNMDLTVMVGNTTYTYKILPGATTGSWYEGDSADQDPMTPEQIADVTTPKDVKRDQKSKEVEPYIYNFDLKLSDASPKGAAPAEYNNNTASFKITPKAVTVKANDQQVQKGTAPDSITYTDTVTGLVNGEQESLISRDIKCNTYTVDTVAGSELEITATGAKKQGNYTVTYQPGKLTVTAAPVTTGTLKVTKKVEGRTLDQLNQDKFKITVKGPSEYSKELSLKDTDVSKDSSQLTATWTIRDLPAGEYTVSEENAGVDGYDCTAAYASSNETDTKKSVTVTENQTSTMTVTNKYKKQEVVPTPDTSKPDVNKTATDLVNDKTDVTLSVGGKSAKENVAVMFLLDKSTSQGIRDEAAQMLDELATKTNTNILYDVVIFSGTARSSGWQNIQDTTTLETIKNNFVNGDVTSGTNMSAGILKAKTDIATLKKEHTEYTETYLITLSDGITYVWSEEDQGPVYCVPVKNIGNSATETKILTGPDVWNMMYDYGDSLQKIYGGVSQFLSAMPSKIAATRTDNHVKVFDSSENPIETYIYNPTETKKTTDKYACGPEAAMYYSITGYAALAKEFTKTFAYAVPELDDKSRQDNEENWTLFPWGREVMEYCKSISFNKDWDGNVSNTNPGKIFSGIKDVIYYEIQSGSITDVIGADFSLTDQTLTQNTFTLTVSGNAVTANAPSGNVITFGNANKDGQYPYVLTYYKGTAAKNEDNTYTITSTSGNKSYTYTPCDKTGEVNGSVSDEFFVLEMNVPVVSLNLKYNLSLTSKRTSTGTYEVPTNESATLAYKSANHNSGTVDFNEPTVSYTVKSSSGSHSGGSRPSLNTKDHYGYIIGYPVDYYTGQPTTDQTKKPVRPEGKITRAEVATIYFRMLTDESRTKFWSQSNSYSDVKAGDWFNNAVSTLSNAGIIAGYEDGSFRPNGYITRAEFATIAARFFDVTYNGKDLFPDISGHWAKDYINQAANKGFVNGYEDGTFKPDRNITRAEAVTLVNRTLDRHPDKNHFTKDMLVWPDNMDQTKWYYADMQEATNSHTYQMKENSDKTKYENWTKTLPIRNWEALEKAWSNANSSQGNGNVV